MLTFLDFKNARCRDCYKCLRECPVKAINVTNHQAKIIDNRCVLCGHCTLICPQNAKVVHSELDEVKTLMASGEKVVASIAPSFITNFDVEDFSTFRIALGKLGFAEAEETAVGAKVVTEEYAKLLKSGQYKNFITSACPSANRLIQLYYPKALQYLAPVDSPMVAHAKILRKQYPNAKIVFVGPCIAKKREAAENQYIDNVLTFEELQQFLDEKEVVLQDIGNFQITSKNKTANLAKSYPISRGIIDSFEALPEGYEYLAVDGIERCMELLENLDSLSGVFIELNTCSNACVNGPCKIDRNGNFLASAKIKNYVKKDTGLTASKDDYSEINFSTAFPRFNSDQTPPTEREIRDILAQTGKTSPEHELNCGACGYNTCREKAIAVYYGFADIDICMPYMRQRAESLSYEIINSTSEGIVILDGNMNIMEINSKARELLGIQEVNPKGRPAIDFFNPSDYFNVLNAKKPVELKHVRMPFSNRIVDVSINLISGQNAVYGNLKDVTKKVEEEEAMKSIKLETLKTTDDVIMKQMRVAQEIASLLGETTAETKVALLKLKKSLQSDDLK